MVIIGNFKVSKGYETWKQAFLDNHEMREKHGIKVLAFGKNETDSDHVYTVIDVPSLEIMQKLMKERNKLSKYRSKEAFEELDEKVDETYMKENSDDLSFEDTFKPVNPVTVTDI